MDPLLGVVVPGPWVLVLLSVAAFVAGFVDAIAGGGGVITVPSLLFAGLPPHVAFGTNKGQSVFGATAALWRYSRAGLVDRPRVLPVLVAAFVGSLGGTRLVLLVSPTVLRPLVLGLLVGVAAYLAFRHRSKPKTSTSAHPVLLAAAISFVIGGYDGFFGPGTGTFLIAAYARFLGDPLDRASANAKVANWASNLAAVILFSVKGVVLWSVVLPMAAAQFAGGWAGSYVAIRNGAPLVRRVVLGVVVVLVAKLAWDLGSSA